jgi:hypothetical protein
MTSILEVQKWHLVYVFVFDVMLNSHVSEQIKLNDN